MTELAIPERPGRQLPEDFVETFSTQLARVGDLDLVLEARRRVLALSRYVSTKADKDKTKHAWLLTLKRIGELLGPAERGGDRRGGDFKSPISDLISKQERYKFRLLAAHWDDVADVMVAAGVRSLLRIIDEIERRMRDEGEITVTLPADISIQNCAAADLDVEAGTTDLILTDPPYPEEYLPCWDDLAKVAERALRPGGLLVAYSGQMFVREALAALHGLEYVWLAAIVHDGPFFQLRKHKVQVGWKPLLVFGKPPVSIDSEWLDTLTDGHREKGYHGWQQAEAEAAQLIEAFTIPGDLVVDPFTGGGTIAAACKQLGRRFTGCDIDAEHVARARDRLS